MAAAPHRLDSAVADAPQPPQPPGVFLFFLLSVVLVSQALLHTWKRRWPRSYMKTTLALLWVFPLGFAVYLGFWRFVLIWATFSVAVLYLLALARAKPLSRAAPRRVYRGFLLLHSLCNLVSIAGFGLMMTASVVDPFGTLGAAVLSFLLLFYGLYFGVLGRDFAELCADSLASNLGFGAKDGMPTRSLAPNACAVCGTELYPDIREVPDREQTERVMALPCGHKLHEMCIRGWTMIGKKDTCPSCNERVNAREMVRNFWETQSVQWAKVLDMVRYTIVWNPIILLAIQLFISYAAPMTPAGVHQHQSHLGAGDAAAATAAAPPA